MSILADDSLYELLGYLPSNFVLSVCVLVSRGWKVIIEDRIKLSFRLDESGWIELSKRRLYSKILHLELEMEARTPVTMDPNRFTSLESISIANINITTRFVNDLLEMPSLKEIEFIRCTIDWLVLERIASFTRPISLSIMDNNVILGLSRPTDNVAMVMNTMRLMKRLKSIDLYQSGYNHTLQHEEREKWCRDLLKHCHLSRISIHLDEISAKYLVQMTQLESLTMFGSQKVGLMDFSPLVKIEKLDISKLCNTMDGQESVSFKDLLPRLKCLCIGKDSLGEADLKIIPTLEKLECVELNDYTGHGNELEFPPNMKHLRVFQSVISEKTLKGLQRTKFIQSVRGLKSSVSNNEGQKRDFKMMDLYPLKERDLIRNTSHTVSIKELWMKYSCIQDEEILLDLSINSTLEVVRLDGTNQEGHYKTARLFSKPLMKGLNKLEIEHMSIPSCEGIESAARLRKLAFYQCALYSGCISSIVNLTSLRALTFWGTDLELGGIEQVALMKNLRYLYLYKDFTLIHKTLFERFARALLTMDHLNILVIKCVHISEKIIRELETSLEPIKKKVKVRILYDYNTMDDDSTI